MPDWRAVIVEQAEIAVAVENVVIKALARTDLATAEALRLWSKVGELFTKAQTVGRDLGNSQADPESIRDFEAIKDIYLALHGLLDARLFLMAGLRPTGPSGGLH
ncbi:hypothetical protein HT585_24175 [Ensifer sp. HO-A22]|uniref:Uncharacterized protein n=1 Tax=Ensifer oleiphilus TaxID=2742698 RepID=A0A7Y6UQF9_9HYPH|nr:hypothetical protein [Ensifer oleiphilus]NVD41969.1 hypothetical protein [Ensifer oleiphilus]